MSREAWVTIADDAFGHAMELDHMVEEQTCRGWSIDGCLACDEMLELGQLAHKNHDGIIA